MTTAWRAIGIAVAAAFLAAMSWASVAPLAVAASGDAILRISLGARPERIETCRTVSDEELAKVAPQMRLRTVCEGTTARYRLEVRRNAELLHAQVVRGGGLRHDRQLYVSRDISVPAGPASFHVRLMRIDTVAATADSAAPGHAPEGGREAREVEEGRRRREEAVPAELSLDVRAAPGPREVVLISYDAERRGLIHVRRTPTP